MSASMQELSEALLNCSRAKFLTGHLGLIGGVDPMISDGE